MNPDISLPIHCHSLSRTFLSFGLGLKDKNRHNSVFLMTHLGERKISLLRKKTNINPSQEPGHKNRLKCECSQYALSISRDQVRLIRCDRTCQRSIIIINKEKPFTPNNSPLSHCFLLVFSLKESS